MVDVELHPHGIAPIFLKKIMHKTHFFSCNFPFFIWYIPFVDIIGIKPAHSDHKSDFKDVGAIPCGCITKWTLEYNTIEVSL